MRQFFFTFVLLLSLMSCTEIIYIYEDVPSDDTINVSDKDKDEPDGGNGDSSSENNGESSDNESAYRGDVASEFKGSGSESNPYLLRDASELRKLADDVNSGMTYEGCYFLMTNDIVLNTDVLGPDGEPLGGANSYEQWIPIGELPDNKFCGFFDGASHVISGLYINSTKTKEETNPGLFGVVAGGASIKHLTIKDSYIDLPNARAAVLVYEAYGKIGSPVVIEDCHVYATIKAECASGILSRGHINRLDSYVDIKSCSMHGKVISIPEEKQGNASGLVWYGGKGCCVVECYNEADVISNGLSGGIAWSANISNCANLGIVKGKRVGALVTNTFGYSKVVNCLNLGIVLGEEISGGLVAASDFGGKIANCINYGVCMEIPSEARGGILAILDRETTVQDNYFVESFASMAIDKVVNRKDCSLSGNYRVRSDEMRSANFLANLCTRSASLGTAYSQWITGPSGFPILDWMVGLEYEVPLVNLYEEVEDSAHNDFLEDNGSDNVIEFPQTSNCYIISRSGSYSFSPGRKYASDLHSLNDGNVEPLDNYYQASGQSIRCIKE